MNNIFLFLFARTYFQTFFSILHKMALAGMNYGGGASVGSSGELYTLEYLRTHADKPVIFDAGANIGDFAQATLTVFGEGSRVYCFEPAKATYKKLLKRVRDNDNITAVNSGLSSKAGNHTLYENDKASGFASVYSRRLDHYNISLNKKETIKLETIDAFCKTNKIKHIDLLKMDVEGHEFAVLQGAESMLSKRAITMIQFEFGGCNIDSRTYFQDFFYLLHPKYRIYRLLQNGMHPIDQYRELDEIFVNTNYLAVLRV